MRAVQGHLSGSLGGWGVQTGPYAYRGPLRLPNVCGAMRRVRPALNQRQWAAMQGKQHKGALGLWEKLFGMCLFREQRKQLH